MPVKPDLFAASGLFGEPAREATDAGPATVAVTPCAPVEGPYDYLTDGDGPPLAPGDYVMAPFGGRAIIGVVWGPGAGDTPAAKLKRIERRLDLPRMSEATRVFLARAADYTLTPLGEMARLATRAPGLDAPPPMRRVLRRGATAAAAEAGSTPARRKALAAFAALSEAGAVEPARLAEAAGVGAGVIAGLVAEGALTLEETPRDKPYPRLDPERPGKPLSAAQAEAAARLRGTVAAGGFAPTLLHGVTGSGKTEVYLEAVAACLAQGRQALVLLPEIALTDAFVARIAERFGARPAEWHSGVGAAERRRCWRAVAEGAAQAVVGARSALFLPFRDLGLIVVDEEHDDGYKQEEGAIYGARDMAVLRASVSGATVVLASATPSLETWVNAERGRYGKVSLPDRHGKAVKPRVETLDLRLDKPERERWIAPGLAAAVAETLAQGEQALLFLNRRGYAPLTLCRACGARFGCPHCESWLVRHRFSERLQCHLCGHGEPAPSLCRSCGADELAACGPGVERLAEEAAARFPQARVAILSSDLAASPTELRARIVEIAEGRADIVVGTQIVAKGHNFPNLTLVGVVDADLGLQGGDFRAAERTFQLLTQVAGRAGRVERPGRAILQTVAPEHAVMKKLTAGDDRGFLEAEAQAREAVGAPPFGRYVAVVLSGADEKTVWAVAQAYARAAEPMTAIGATVLGPAPAPIARIRGKSRVRLLVRADRAAPIQAAARAWEAAVRALRLPGRGGVRVVFDVDPRSFL